MRNIIGHLEPQMKGKKWLYRYSVASKGLKENGAVDVSEIRYTMVLSVMSPKIFAPVWVPR